MKIISFISAVVMLVLISGCQTVSNNNPRHHGKYLEVGISDSQLIGSKYYFAMGRVNLYLAGVIPVGVADVSVAVLVNEHNGMIQRIVTLQPNGRKTYFSHSSANSIDGLQVNATSIAYGDMTYKIDNLIGGIDAIDIQRTNNWAEAVNLVLQLSQR